MSSSSLNVHRLNAAYTYKYDSYHGPYGWNDKTGKPLKTADLHLAPEDKRVPAEMEILTRAPAEEELKIEIVKPAEPVPRPMIQVIETVKTTPTYSLTPKDGDYVLYIELPGVESSSELKLRMDGPKSIILTSDEFHLDLTLPNDAQLKRNDLMKAKFIRPRLKVKIERVGAPC
jgi:HSP20 family molecular chaperone IbpA